MKKILFILLTTYYVLHTTNLAFGQTALTPSPRITPTPTISPDAINKQIDSLKDKIASRVAQLQLVEKRGIIGTVTDVSETQITIADINGNTRFIDVDELTHFSSPSSKNNFGISDITKGNTIGVLGLYNKDSRRLLARFVDVMVIPVIISGAVTGIDSTNFNLTVTTLENKATAISVENVTKTYVFAKDAGLTKAGFSKIAQGQRIMVIGFWDVKNKTTLIASRIIVLPTVTVNPKIITVAAQNLGVTPSTGSGTKLIPIINNK